MGVRDVFERCRSAALEIKMIDSLMAHVGSIGAPCARGVANYNDININTNNSSSAENQKIEAIFEKLDKRKRELVDMTYTAYLKINELDDSVGISIMSYYYLMGYSDEKIADIICMARETVTRKRNRALENLERMEV